MSTCMTQLQKNGKKIDSLSFPRCRTTVTVINDNAIIVIGGCIKAMASDAKSNSLSVVELGQVGEVHVAR